MVLSRPSFALTVALALAAAACSRGSSGTPPAGRPAASAAPASPSSSNPSAIAAEVDGAPILQSDLDARAANRLARLRQEEYEIRKQALDELVADRLLDAEAKRRGVSREELLKREVDAKAESTPASTVESIYEQNKQRFGSLPKEQALARIRTILGERTQAERKAAFADELRGKARVVVHLEPPRVEVAVPPGAPATGPDSAAVSIVEFTDYQCPYCHRAQKVIDEVLARYAGKVRLVHMDFPLDGHPGAVPAARAARCAGEQGRFWEYHRDLMVSPGSLDDADLKARARKVRLDPAAFASCVASTRHDQAIESAFRQGEELGVTGTPAYFVNGRMLSGARPLSDFAELIDSELSGR